MEAAAAEPAPACEIARLPDDLLAASIARTTPRDACRAAAVSSAFRAVADSDAVWSRFLPRALPQLSDGEIPNPAPPSKKHLFMRLTDRRVLLADGLMTMWLDRETGVKCYMLSARSLSISWGDTPHYWSWIPQPSSSFQTSRFREVAELRSVCWLELRGKIDSRILSQGAAYAAYIVFKTSDWSFGLDCPQQDASITVAGSTSTRKVCLQRFDDELEEVAHAVHWGHVRYRGGCKNQGHRECSRNSMLPQRRADGWMELELGKFCSNDAADTGDVCISLTETKGPALTLKAGLIVQGFEIRPKKTSSP